MTQRKLSILDANQVIKEVHNAKDGSLNITRVNSLVPASYGKVDLTYTTIGTEDYIDTATYYGDGESELTQVKTYSDIAGSLNNKYFTIYSANNVTKYHVWFNNGTGVDPAPPASTPIEVSYLNGDDKSIIALKASIALNNNLDFAASAAADSLLIYNVTHGVTTNSVEGNTGFILYTVRSGTDRKIVVVLQFSYDGAGNITSIERIFFT